MYLAADAQKWHGLPLLFRQVRMRWTGLALPTKHAKTLRTEDVSQDELEEVKPLSPAARSHVALTTRLWLGLPAADPRPVPEMPEHLARLFLRCEEWEIASRDQWGNFEHGLAANTLRDRLWHPEVDDWLEQAARALPADLPREPLWPGGHRFALCLSHDVDAISTQFSQLQYLRLRRREAVTRETPDPADRAFLRDFDKMAANLASRRNADVASSAAASMDLSIAVEKEFGIKGSYFFPVWPPKVDSRYDCLYEADDRYTYLGRVMTARDIMLELAAQGHDVGLHGGYQTALDLENFLHEKHLLEDETGLSVTTTRQHWLHWDARVTPELHVRAGITADSTLGYNRNVGFRAGTSKPYFFFDVGRDRALDLVQLPMIIMDGSVFSTVALEMDLPRAKALAKLVMDRIIATGGCVSLLFHPENLAAENTFALYRWCVAYCMERGAWGASVKQIEDWWRSRSARLENPMQQLEAVS